MDRSQKISPQYITKDKITVTILDMIHPAHFIVKESPDLMNASSAAKRFLEAEEAMQKYYASVRPCFFQLPLKDSIIIVLFRGTFYRARVINILNLSMSHLFKVYLVDYGIECSVPKDSIYEIERDFLVHPFQAVSVKLLGIEPVSLVMDSADLSLSYGPVDYWDPAASIYVQDLQKGMCNAYIEVQGLKDQHVYGRLYMFYESIPEKCINDELISNSYARFNEDCLQDIQTLDSIFEEPGIKANIPETAKSSLTEKINPEQVSSSNIFDFNMMFLDPVDGKVVAESSFTKDSNLESPSEKEAELQLQAPQESQPPEATLEEQKAQLIAQKQLQKLQELNRKKRQSLNQSSDSSSESTKSSQTDMGGTKLTHIVSVNETFSDCKKENGDLPCTVSSEESANESPVSTPKSSVSSICDNSEPTLIAQRRLQKLQLLNKRRLQSPILQCKEENASPQGSLSGDSTISSNGVEFKSKEVNDESVSDSSTATERAESISQAQMMAQNRLIKLQKLNRKQLRSPICPSLKDPNVVNISPSVPPDKSVIAQEATESPGQETESRMTENIKTLQRLQDRLRAKRLKEFQLMSQNTSEGHTEEVNMNSTSLGHLQPAFSSSALSSEILH